MSTTTDITTTAAVTTTICPPCQGIGIDPRELQELHEAHIACWRHDSPTGEEFDCGCVCSEMCSDCWLGNHCGGPCAIQCFCGVDNEMPEAGWPPGPFPCRFCGEELEANITGEFAIVNWGLTDGGSRC